MAFQICEIIPEYCQITDGHIGNRVGWRSHAYESQALAHKIAGRKSQEAYEGCGDNTFVVVKFGESPFSRPLYSQFWNDSTAVNDDDMPF